METAEIRLLRVVAGNRKLDHKRNELAVLEKNCE
jgi:hypothetical protein